jgi:hypothetical protein
VLMVNAVLAVAIGCSFYLARYLIKAGFSNPRIARYKPLHTAE